SVPNADLSLPSDPTPSASGAGLPTFTASYAGFVNGDTSAALTGALTVTTAATATSPVGTYAITAAGQTSGNYTITYVAGTLTVTKAALTVTADDKTKVYGAGLPTFTASYAGFVNGDTSAALTGALTVTTAATAASPVGTYAITAAGQTSGNYTITYVAGTLTVTEAAQ